MAVGPRNIIIKWISVMTFAAILAGCSSTDEPTEGEPCACGTDFCVQVSASEYRADQMCVSAQETDLGCIYTARQQLSLNCYFREEDAMLVNARTTLPLDRLGFEVCDPETISWLPLGVPTCSD